MRSNYDVIIVGAGLVGLTLASLLAKQELDVVVVDSTPVKILDLKPNDYQLRVSAINLAAANLLNDIDVWNYIVGTQRLSAFEKMFVWDNLGRGEINFDCTEIGETALGYIIENSILHNAILDRLLDSDHITILSEHEPSQISIQEHTITLRLNKETELVGQLIVGADGGNSWVRRHANIISHQKPYHHRALVTTVQTELSHQKTAWQCFLPDGPLALLPLFEDNVCSVVWSAPPDEIIRLENLETEAFNREITQAFEHRLGDIKKISGQASYPLNMQHAKNYTRPRVALIGDAAHTLHPLAGQGVNLGFADAYSLAENIKLAKQKQRDCGDYLWLRRFERARKSDNWMMIFGMEFFKQLFTSDFAVAIFLRSLGLKMVNRIHLIKDQFIYKAIGKDDIK